MEIQYIVPIIIGLVEVIKRTGFVGENFAPLLAVVLGVGIGVTGGLTVDNALNGIIAALLAQGLYDQAKKGAGAVQEIKDAL